MQIQKQSKAKSTRAIGRKYLKIEISEQDRHKKSKREQQHNNEEKSERKKK